MAASSAQILEVRENIGEVIAAGQTEADTMFTDAQITTWIDNSSSIDGASLRGWKLKMANFANLVNVTDGAASREFSDLFAHAQDMVKMYTKLSLGATAGRARVGKIVRS